MATVYLAQDLKHERPVAIKVLRREIAVLLGPERFLREIKVTAQLDYPHILPLLDSGEAEGFLFYVMPYVEGESLRDRLAREQQLPIEDALQITREVADALGYAHSRGIIHRDIKPENVLLAAGHARVADFGIARAISVAGGEKLTETGMAVGTPAYMSPEQASGQSIVDARSDVYALGCMLYEMLAGAPPFTGPTAQAVLARKLTDHVPPVRTVRDTVPEMIERAILRALARVPADRFPTATGFTEALEEATRGTPGRQRAGLALQSITRVVRAPPSPRRVAVGAAAALGIGALVVGAILLVRQRAHADTGALSRVVVMPFENRSGDASLDPVGAITADWVAQGLIEPGFLIVRDTRDALAAAQVLGPGATPAAVGRETGAGVVIAGSYFLQGDSLEFQARVVSAGDGTILQSIQGTGPRVRPLDGVAQLRQRVLGALASLHDRDVSSFLTRLSQPPTYDAYREYTEGLERYMRLEYPEAARHFERAAALDSTFLTARVWAAQSELWSDPLRTDSIVAGLTRLQDRLSPLDRARFDFVVALRPRDLGAAYRAALRMVDAAPGSDDAEREAALAALRVMRPRETLRRLHELNPARGLLRGWPGYWSAVAWAHHLLGEHTDELSAARRRRELFPGTTVFYELRGLAALGRIQELDSLMPKAFPGDPYNGSWTAAIAGELLAHKHPEAARRFAAYALRLTAQSPPPDSAEAEARDAWLHARVDLALFLHDTVTAAEGVAQVHDWEEHRVLLARLLATEGRRDSARTTLEAARRDGAAVGVPPSRQLQLDEAGALVLLGDADGALKILAVALAADPVFLETSGQNGHAVLELSPLWNDPRFRALIKPRG